MVFNISVLTFMGVKLQHEGNHIQSLWLFFFFFFFFAMLHLASGSINSAVNSFLDEVKLNICMHFKYRQWLTFVLVEALFQ